MTRLKHGAVGLLAAAWLTIGPPAQAQDAVDPKGVALSEQLLDLTDLKSSIEAMLSQAEPILTIVVQNANPGKEAQATEVMKVFVLPRMKQRLPEMAHSAAAIYSKHFSTEELSQLVQFYQSPLGQKLVREQHAMSGELGQLGSVWAQHVAGQVIKENAEEFQRRGLRTPNFF